MSLPKLTDRAHGLRAVDDTYLVAMKCGDIAKSSARHCSLSTTADQCDSIVEVPKCTRILLKSLADLRIDFSFTEHIAKISGKESSSIFGPPVCDLISANLSVESL